MLFSWRAKYLFGLLTVPFIFRALESVNGPWPIPFKWPEINNEAPNFDYDTRKRLFHTPGHLEFQEGSHTLDTQLLCKDSSTCAPTTVDMPRKIVSAPAVAVSTCIVGGNLAAETEALTCFAERKRAIGSVRGMRPADIDKFCGSTNKFHSVQEMSKNIRIRLRDMRKWTFVMVGRDPLERFLHGFVKHCVLGNDNCYGCGKDVGCFADSYHIRLLQYAMYNKENYKFVGDLDWDLFPQTWMCDVEQWKPHYKIIHLSRNLTRLTHDFADLFGERNIFAIRSILSRGEEQAFLGIYENSHFEELIEAVSQNKEFLRLIAKMYHNDYKMLGYDLKLI